MSWDPTGREGSASNNDAGGNSYYSMHQGQNMDVYHAVKDRLANAIITQSAIDWGGPSAPGSVGTGPGVAGGRTGSVSGAGPGNPGVGQAGGVGSANVELAPLKQKLKKTVTQLQVGALGWQSNPWFSDADQYAQRYGEGEIAETLFLVTNVLADTVYNAMEDGKTIGGAAHKVVSDAWKKFPKDAPKGSPEPWAINPPGSAPVIGW